jgi:hypothetical protein
MLIINNYHGTLVKKVISNQKNNIPNFNSYYQLKKVIVIQSTK